MVDLSNSKEHIMENRFTIEMVKIENIISSPFKDTKLNPPTEEQYEHIRNIIKEAGIGEVSICGRRKGSKVELSSGHKTVEVLEQLGYKEVPIKIENVSDAQMEDRFVISNVPRKQNKIGYALETYQARQSTILKIYNENKDSIENLKKTLTDRYELCPTTKEITELLEVDFSQSLKWLDYCGRITKPYISLVVYGIIKEMLKVGYILNESYFWELKSFLLFLKAVPEDKKNKIFPMIDHHLNESRHEYEKDFKSKKNKISSVYKERFVSQAAKKLKLSGVTRDFTKSLTNSQKKAKNNVSLEKINYIYLFEEIRAGYLKLGHSSNIEERLLKIQTIAFYSKIKEWECSIAKSTENKIHGYIPNKMRINKLIDLSRGSEIYDLKYKQEILEIIENEISNITEPEPPKLKKI